jgi:hypothetical protein
MKGIFMTLFISYRRKDNGKTHRLAEQLKCMLQGDVYIDYQGIKNTDFEKDIVSNLASCDAMILIVTPETFGSRIHNEDDWIRREIALALKLQKPVTPVCIDGIGLPRKEDLPPDIWDITKKEAKNLHYDFWDEGVDKLVQFLVEATPLKLSLCYWFHKLTEIAIPILLFLCAVLASITGGWIWNIINDLLNWSYHLGGSGNEPHGIQAFIWGFLAVCTIPFFALVASYRLIPHTKISLYRATLFIVLYAILGGLGAIIFYDAGFRTYIETTIDGYTSQEMIIVVIWSFLISSLSAIPIMLSGDVFKSILNRHVLPIQIFLAITFSFLAVAVSLFISVSPSEVAQLRGFFAGVALRLGLFIGIVIAIYAKPRSFAA